MTIHYNLIKDNAFASAGSKIAATLFDVITNHVEQGGFAVAIDLLGQYFEWRLKGAQEPSEGCDHRAFMLQDRVQYLMKGGSNEPPPRSKT